ncbi:hypothetical protein [Chryseobacterium sp.]|uniref:hypothetical protein n=1 Tax=Chryseobacterium sp. TaxID=1871047 RepID=UPI0028A15C67|nr:hypothetical protein [Chryseobacterium sp.]
MKIKIKDIFSRLFIFFIFFVGFVISGTFLIIYGYNHSNDVIIIFGSIITCLGLFQILHKYKISYLFGAIPVLAVVISFFGIPLFFLFYFPFFYKESLALDLGILILKDWFIRVILIIIDILIVINVFIYIKKQIIKIRNRRSN